MAKKNRRAKRRRQFPDETFSHGPIQMARFGTNVVARADWAPGQFEEAQEELAQGYPEVVREIDSLIAEASALVSALDPGALLHRAWWQRAAIHLGLGSESEVTGDHAMAARMLDYVQSLIASTPPAPIQRPPDDGDWAKLEDLVEKIFGKISFNYLLRFAAKQRKEAGSSYDPLFQEFQYMAQVHWCNVTGEQYQVHQIPTLRQLVVPQTEIVQSLYGISGDQLCNELQKIWDSLTKGVGQAYEEMDAHRQRCIEAVQANLQGRALQDTEVDELLGKAAQSQELRAESERVAGLWVGLDLFDLQKVTQLPTALLEDFAWSPGADREFFAEGEFRGWPLRVWPTFKRPFLKLEGRYYCFDQSTLFDHFYRQLEKRSYSLGEAAKQSWIATRKQVSEALPFDYLRRLLPGATCHTELYYHASVAGAITCFETDGLVIYDDHLFIVEVKSGAFTYTSPATDVVAHVESLRGLLAAPARQGQRVLDYLRSAETVAFHNVAGDEVVRVRLQDFRCVSVCAISLDAFTELAAQAQHLASIGLDLQSSAIWPLSIDDLRVYADVFTNPLEFLHYVEQRNAASTSELLHLSDELDHLGLYLEHNHYVRHAAGMVRGQSASMQALGYRTEIDKLFTERLYDAAAPSPLRQRMPLMMAALLDWLQHSGTPGRSAVASYVLDLAGDARDTLFAQVEQEGFRVDGRPPRCFSMTGEARITALAGTPIHPADMSALRALARTTMVLAQEADRLVFVIELDAQRQVVGAQWEFLRTSALSAHEQRRLTVDAENLRQTRIARALQAGAPQRNAPCPCGSGKKYKKCCWLRI